ncbi:MAG: S4 domain-containing protein [Candidatus Thorarchaeota archaeon]
MPRLDIWLTETGQFSSRQAAKRAIRAGHVTVDGKKVKPSKQVTGEEEIIISSESLDFPVGYSKLKEIQDTFHEDLVKRGDFALDIGSSAGGFLLYLAEKGAHAIGIEVSETFADVLHKIVETHPNLSLIMGDAFHIDPYDICEPSELDILLIDVTTDPSGTLDLIKLFSPILKKNGRLVAAFKSKGLPEEISEITSHVSDLGFTQIDIITLDNSRKELHIVALRQ